MKKSKKVDLHFVLHPSGYKDWCFMQCDEYDILEDFPEGVLVWDFMSAIRRAACECQMRKVNSFEIIWGGE